MIWLTKQIKFLSLRLIINKSYEYSATVSMVPLYEISLPVPHNKRKLTTNAPREQDKGGKDMRLSVTKGV